MDINAIAQKLKDKIQSQGGILNLPTDFPIKCDSIGMALGYLSLTAIKLAGLTPDKISVVDNQKLKIADAQANILGVNVANMQWTFTQVSEDQYYTAYTASLNGISIDTLVKQGLITLDKVSDPSIFPAGLFNNVVLKADTQTFTLNMLCDSSNLNINLLTQFGLALTNLGFGLILTKVPGSAYTDVQFQLSGTLALGKTNLAVALVVPITSQSTKNIWMINFSSTTPLVQGLADLVKLFLGINLFSILPDAVVKIGNLFSIKRLQVVFNPVEKKVNTLLLDLGSQEPWDVIPGKFKVEKTGVTFNVKWQNNQRLVNTRIIGDFKFSQNPAINLGIEAIIPAGNNDWELSISSGTDLPEIDKIENLNNANIPGGIQIASISLPSDILKFNGFNLEEFTISFNPSNKTISFIKINAEVDVEWKVITGILEIAKPSVNLTIKNPLNANRVIFGEIKGQVTLVSIPFDVSATKEEDSVGWKFTTITQPGAVIDLKGAVNQLLKPLDAELPKEIFPSALGLTDVGFTVDMTDTVTSYVFTARTNGTWSFKLGFLPQIDITAATTLTKKGSDYSGLIKGTFILKDFANLKIGVQYQFAKDTKDLRLIFWDKFIAHYLIKGSSQELSIEIGDISLGQLLTNIMQFIGVNNFKLEAPWTILNDINLEGFKVTLDLKTKNVSVGYTLKNAIDLGFITITELTLGTQQKNDRKIMTLGIKGRFLGKEIGDNDPFGKNNQQDVQNMPQVPNQGNAYFDLRALALGQRVSIGANKFTNIPDVIKAIRQLNTPTGDAIPIGGPGQPTFAAQNGWLFATNFGILKVGSVYTVDLSVVFADPELYGLRIEMNGEKAKIFAGLKFEILYRKISDSVGVYQMELTLPNAMRYLDFGAISVVLPVVGLQIYTNGDFKVDIGFPYNMDFSRSFTVQGIIYGVPVLGSGGLYFGKLSSATSNQVPKATCGEFNPVLIFGIGMQLGIGRYIDKGILKAGFSITVVGILEGIIATWLPYAIATPGQPTPEVQKSYYFKVQGTFGILGKLYGTVDFAIIKASVSLTVYVMANITYESYKAIFFSVSAGVSVAVSISIDFGLFSISIDFSFSTHIEENFQLGSDHLQDAPWACISAPPHTLFKKSQGIEVIQLVFKPYPKQADNEVKIYFTPHLAVNSENSTTSVQPSYVSMLFVDCPVFDKKEQKTISAKTSFDTITENIFMWLIAAATPAEVLVDFKNIPISLLKDIYAALSVKGYIIPYDKLSDFLTNQLAITAYPLTDNINATVFPMPPVFGLTTELNDTPQYDVTYNKYSFADNTYLGTLSDYFNQLAVQVQKEMGNAQSTLRAGADTKNPISQYIFQDYFLLTAKQTIQDCIDAAQNYRREIQGTGSIQSVLDWANSIQKGNLSASDVLNANKTHALTKDNIITVSGLSYQVKASDSFSGIAGNSIYSVTASSLILLNATSVNILTPGIPVTYSGTTYAIQPGDTLTSLAKALGTDINSLASNVDFQKLTNVLLPLATITIPSVSYKVIDGDTLQKILSLYNTTIDVIASEPKNISLNDFFVKGKNDEAFLVITGLKAIGKDDLFTMLTARGKSAELAGMIGRYQMHGLRLPLAGITFADSVVPQCQVGTAKDCSMWSITGQQFPLPVMKNTDTYKITLKNNNCPYIGGGDLAVTLKPNDIDIINAVSSFARNTNLRPEILNLEAVSPVDKIAGNYSFRNYYQLRTASKSFVLPYDKRTAQQKLATPAPILWSFPPALLNLLTQKKATAPLMSLQLGKFNSGRNILEFSPATFYGYSTVLEVNIKRVPTDEKASSRMGAFTYEVVGSTEAGTALLEKLLSAMPTGNDDIISQISLLYQPNPTATDAKGYLTDGSDNVNMFLTQVNLSTDTNPVALLAATSKKKTDENVPTGVLNSKYDFIKLLWECSIVRSGGYYLYYQETQNNNALPDMLFDRDGNATISILITYTANTVGDIKLPLFNYMNSVVTADQLDPSIDSVASRSEENVITYTPQTNDSILSISAKYHTAPSEIALANTTATLKNSITLDVKNIQYEVRPEQRKPGRTLAGIADYFGVTQEAIKKLNPEVRNFDNIAVWSLLRIPDLQYVVSGTAAQGNTLKSIAAYYFITIESLSFYNESKASIFSSDTITIKDQILDYKQVVPQGNVGFNLARKNPNAIPKLVPGKSLPPDYPEKFLQNEYQLLTYSVSDNAYFSLSDFGLPVGPLKSTRTEQNAGVKVDSNDDTNWLYEQVVNIYTYAKYNPIIDKKNLPSAADNIYAGISGYAQLFLDWQDTYGNRITNTFTNPTIDPLVTLNNLPIKVGYTDALLGLDQWPCITTNYQFEKLSLDPLLLVDVSFDNSRYDPSQKSASYGNQGSEPLWKQNAKADREVYKTIYYQLNQQYAPDPTRPTQLKRDITIKLTTTLVTNNSADLPADQIQNILTFVSDIYVYLDMLIEGTIVWDPNQKPTIKAPLSTTIGTNINSNNIFELLVSVGIYRDIVRVHDDFLDDTSVYEAICSVNPQSKSGDTAMNLTTFATSFEGIFASNGVVLKVATASGANPNEYKRESKGIWIVRWALKDGAKGIYYQKSEKLATVYAARPLSTELEGYPDIPIYPYETGKGIDWQSQDIPKKTFTGIDLDSWSRQLLLGVDAILSPAYVNSAFWISKLYKTDPQNPNPKEDLLLSITASKKSLADSLSKYLTPILKDYTGDNLSAQEKFRQALLIRLSDFYSISAVVQYPMSITADWNGQELGTISYPRLYGSMKGELPATFKGSDGKDNGFSLSNAKVVLNNGVKVPSWLNFVFTVKNPEDQTFVPLNLNYHITHLEHNITHVDGIQDYEASNWLNFVIVPTDNNLTPSDPLQIPIVLRAYPTPPSLTSQIGSKSNVDSKVTIDTARQWDFNYDYTQYYALQDTIHSEMRYNIRNAPMANFASNAQLFAKLAQFISTFPDIQKDLIASLKLITDKTTLSSPEYKIAVAALRSFKEIVEKVANAWTSGYLFAKGSQEEFTGQYKLSVIERPERNVEPIDNQRLLLTIIAADNQTKGLILPSINIDDYKPVPPEKSTKLKAEREYKYVYQSLKDPKKYLTVGEAKGIKKRTVSVSPIDVIAFQNALSFIKVKRNENLVQSNTGQWIPTADDFVYQTPLISFGNKLIPLLDYSNPLYKFNIAKTSATLKQHMINMLTAIIGTSIPFDLALKVEIGYNYTLQNDPTSIDVTLPVFLAPAVPLIADSPADFDVVAANLAEAMNLWNNTYTPQGYNRKFFFDVSVYSGINESKMPLLRLRYLYLNLADITS